MDWIKIDDLSIILGVGLASAFVLAKVLRPQSLVHPLLLGRQADVDRVRLPGESAVYRSYATGIMGRLPERPKPEVRILGDLIPEASSTPRKLWLTTITSAELKERVEVLGTGLNLVASLTPRSSTAMLLLDDSLEFLITDLALASQSIVSFTLSSFSLFKAALVKHAPQAIIIPGKLLEQVLNQIEASGRSAHHFIIVLGVEKGSSTLHSVRTGIQIMRWEDIEEQGKLLAKSDVEPPESSDVFGVFLFDDEHGELHGAQLTHANVTAGVTAARLLFPTAPITPADTIFSVFSITTPFGRSLAYTALYDGANFISLPVSLESNDASKTTSELIESCEASAATPTLLFMTPEHLKKLTSMILKAASSNLLFNLAWRHKAYGLQEGFITKVSFWDNLIFDGARRKVLGKMEASLRGIVVSEGPLEVAAVEPARIGFSLPIVYAHTHPLVCGPVMVSHPLDLQTFPGDAEPRVTLTHVGPPAPNVEVKLVGVLESSVETGGDFVGEILVRGPSVAATGMDVDGWVALNEKGRVQTNGTFKIL